jgi:hypothetical protein
MKTGTRIRYKLTSLLALFGAPDIHDVALWTGTVESIEEGPCACAVVQWDGNTRSRVGVQHLEEAIPLSPRSTASPVS